MERRRGLLFVLTGAILWGIGGTVAKKLFQDYGVNVHWLVNVRLLIAGILLLAIQYGTRDRKQITAVWKKKKTAVQLTIYGIIGMLAVQYTYLESIRLGNAAVATLLQYLAPVMIILYMVIRKHSAFTRRDGITVVLALIGCFFLLTNGSVSALSVPPAAIVWGIVSGAALAFYTLYAVPLLKEFDSLVIVGWAMLIGGTVLSLIYPPWQVHLPKVTPGFYLYLAFVLLFSTMLAFWFYIESLKGLSAKETSLISSIEPLAAVLTTVFWLHEPFGGFQWLGTLFIIAMILYMALGEGTPAMKNESEY